MTTMTIVNYMKAGPEFCGLCLFASATITAIRIARKDPEYVAKDEPEEATYRRFNAKLNEIDSLRRMWNALNPRDIWDYTSSSQFSENMWKIWAKYRRIERGER